MYAWDSAQSSLFSVWSQVLVKWPYSVQHLGLHPFTGPLVTFSHHDRHSQLSVLFVFN